MTRASQSEQRLKLKRSEKIFRGLGMTMVVVSLSIWILTEALAPDLAKPTWYIASPGLTLLTLLVGLYLVLRGTKKLIKASLSRLDNTLDRFIAYRITRWIGTKVLLLVLAVLGFFFSALANAPDRGDSKASSNSPISDRGDGAWDVASDHYYDKEPPPPFS